MTRRKADTQATYRGDDGRVNRETEHGTVAGYLRHQWDLSHPCVLCRIAWDLFADRPPPKNARRTFDREWTTP